MDVNVTIASIVYIITLIVPGVFFKRLFFQGHFSKQFGSGLFGDRMITSLFWGIIVQILTLLLFKNTLLLEYEKTQESIIALYPKLLDNKIPDFSYKNLQYVLGYLSASIFVSLVLGHLFHLVIRKFGIDLKFRIFRFSNNWNYYFKGEVLRGQEFKNSRKGNVIFTEVDIVTHNGDGKTKMYSGYLTDYSLKQDGELENIYLTETRRYSQEGKCFKPIPGDCFIVPYKNIQNLNLTYEFEEKKDSTIKRKIATTAFNVIGFLTLFGILIIPWFLNIGIWDKIWGIVVSLLSWFSMMAAGLNLISHKRHEENVRQAIIILFVFSILMGLFALFIFDIISTSSIIAYFKKDSL